VGSVKRVMKVEKFTFGVKLHSRKNIPFDAELRSSTDLTLNGQSVPDCVVVFAGDKNTRCPLIKSLTGPFRMVKRGRFPFRVGLPEQGRRYTCVHSFTTSYPAVAPGENSHASWGKSRLRAQRDSRNIRHLIGS